MKLLLVCAFALLALASAVPVKEPKHEKTPYVADTVKLPAAPVHAKKIAPVPALYGSKHYFYGQYPGTCGADGFYYNDEYSFVICSNGNSYVQPCAPGSRNDLPGLHKGGYYGYSDFCSVNLNDYGYAAHYSAGYAPYNHGGYPYGYPSAGYGNYWGHPGYWK